MRPSLAAVAELHAQQLAAHYGRPGGRDPGRLRLALVWGVLLPALASLSTGAVLDKYELHGVVASVTPFAVPSISLTLFLIFALPWHVARLVLVPLGLARPAYHVASLAGTTFRLDPAGGAAVAAAWALGRQRRLDEETADWLAGRLAAQAPLRGAGLLASGLLLSARGDLDGARALIGAVLDLDPRARPPIAARLAGAWLAADAAERGDWARVAALGQTPGQSGRIGWLLSAVAQSLLLEPMSPGKHGLWIRWALAPHRAETLPMVERAIRALDGGFIEPEDDPPIAPTVPEGDAVRTALSLHAAVLTRPREALRPDDVRAVGQAWDAALADRALERVVLERALSVGASGAGAVLEKMRAAVEDDLADAVMASGMPLKDLSGQGAVASRVRARLRDRLLTEIEAASDAIRRRTDDQRALPPADEWREWENLRVLYERGVKSAGDDLRRLAFAKVYSDACAYSVWLYNDQKQRPLANAIFRWLLAEATVLDDSRAVTLMTKNVDCGV